MAADVTEQAAAPHLLPMISQVESNVGEKPDEASADAGYFSESNVTWLLQEKIIPYVPPDKLCHRPSSWGRVTERTVVQECDGSGQDAPQVAAESATPTTTKNAS